MTTIQYPESNDLRNLVRFSEKDGTIWLAENRMVLMHTSALGSLRKELVGSVGKEHARRLLTRMGYTSGVRDAELAMRIRGEKSLRDAFFTGPQLHMLEGIVRVTPIRMEMDVQSGHFAGEFLWENSWEQDTHIREMGQSDEPVCWSQIGYASGYTSAFMGRFILFKEVECVACGRQAAGGVGGRRATRRLFPVRLDAQPSAGTAASGRLPADDHFPANPDAATGRYFKRLQTRL